MTFWIGPDGPGGVHVLIVGVATYGGGDLEELPGAAYSASKLAEWWVRSPNRMLHNHHLASIEVLISSEITPCLFDPDGQFRSIEPATRNNVIKAFQEWSERSQKGGLAVLHWIGHGENLGKDGKGPTHALYCGSADPNGRSEGIDWPTTALAINHALEDRAICFIDTCRNEVDVTTRHGWCPPALTPGGLEGPQRSAILYSTRDGMKSYCLPVRDINTAEKRGEFRGGALFSHALMWALDGYAAVERGPKRSFKVHEDDLIRVIRNRVELWSDLDERIARLDFYPQGSNAIKWFDRAIVHAPTPVSSIRFQVDDEDLDPEAMIFDINPENEPWEKTTLVGQWHVDMPRGTGWKAQADCPETDRCGPRTFIDRFNTVLPFDEVEMAEVFN